MSGAPMTWPYFMPGIQLDNACLYQIARRANPRLSLDKAQPNVTFEHQPLRYLNDCCGCFLPAEVEASIDELALTICEHHIAAVVVCAEAFNRATERIMI